MCVWSTCSFPVRGHARRPTSHPGVNAARAVPAPHIPPVWIVARPARLEDKLRISCWRSIMAPSGSVASKTRILRRFNLPQRKARY